MSWDFENAKQLQLPFIDTREEWEVNGFKTKEEWCKACAFDREFKYLKSLNLNDRSHFDYLSKNS